MADAEALAAETPVEEVPAGPTHEPFSFKLLAIVQKQQGANGLRHSDHHRYRQYCSRRLERIYDVLRHKHGRGRYKAVPFPADFQDDRWLEIPLVSAERAWSYGMQLKMDNATASTVNPRWRRHSIMRFSKAVKWAQMLEATCKIHADQRTQMEAEAYAAFLEGVYLVEKESWPEALTKVSRCKKVCEYLSLASGPEEAAFLKTKAQELAPLLRECKYNLGMSMDDDDDEDRPKTAGGKSVDISGLSYRGQGLAIPSDKIKGKLVKCLQQSKEVKAAMKDEETAGVNERYGAIYGEFGDILKDIHTDMITAVADGQTAEWKRLEAFAREQSIALNVERNLLLLLGFFKRLEPLEDVTTVDAKKVCRPEEGIRYCDLLKEGLTNLEELPEASEAISAGLTAYMTVVMNCRCLFLALCYTSVGKVLESAALLDMLHGRIDDVALGDKLPDPLGHAHSLFERVCGILPARVAQWRCRGLAQLCSSMQREKAGGDDETGAVTAQRSNAVEESSGFAAFPPKIRDIPCKPLLFDLAFPCIVPPALDQLLASQAAAGAEGQKKGILGRVAGVAGGLTGKLGGLGSLWGRK